MKLYREGHVQAVIDLYEKMSRLPEWEIKEWSKLRDKKDNAIDHMKKHAKEEN